MDSTELHISNLTGKPQEPAPRPPAPEPVPVPLPPKDRPPRSREKMAIIVASIISLALIGGILWWALAAQPPTQDLASVNTSPKSTATPKPTTTPAKATTVDLTKLPIGDGKRSSTARQGYVQTCRTSFPANAPGAQTAGPWMNQAAGTWDATRKVAVGGDVDWPEAKLSITSSGTNRLITSNALPEHLTGIYPVRSSDPAYQYDRNPGSIQANDLSFTLPLNPTVQSSTSCIFGEVAILLSGSVLFDAFDAGGRDAVAWELQDKCAGHPNHMYHYHGYTPCVKDNSPAGAHSDLVGYAFDGFGLYGLKGEGGVQLGTKDLDECHGHTHAISWNGSTKSMYHYHLTRDFPYSVGCFRGARSVSGPVGQAPR
jgi:hypothetical protein